jgi:hypothetical protein
MQAVHAIAVGVGIVVFLTVQYFHPEVQAFFLRSSLGADYQVYLWPLPAAILTRTFLYLAPGFVAGLCVRRFGMVVGFATGFLGALLSQLLFSPEIANSPPLFSYQWAAAIAFDLSAGIIGAAAGAAGQIVRSNTSLERTRER